LQIKVDTNDSIAAYSKIDDFDSLVIQLIREINDDDPEKISLSVTIYKTKAIHTVSIYNLSWFIEFILTLSFLKCLDFLAKYISATEWIDFELFGDDNDFIADAIRFVKTSSLTQENEQQKYQLGKQERLNRIKGVSYYSSAANHPFIPEDFYPKNISAFPAFAILFQQLSLYAIITSLFDITSPTEDGINYKFNGFKSFTGEQKISSFPIKDLDEYYQIYLWTFESGNLTDKAGLMRNILSLHFVDNQSLAITGQPLTSMKSAFDIYLKQNIKQYIEIRNKISEQLIDFNKRANQIIETLASSFQKSALATMTFFASVIITKVLAQKDLTGIFNNESYLLTWLFVIISLLYFQVSLREVTSQRARFIQSYENMKARYTDLLVDDDIKKILANDKDHNDDLQYLSEKTKLYRQLWIGVIVAILGISTLLYLLYLKFNYVNVILIFSWLILVMISVAPFRKTDNN
jgi:hypothetical protein